MDKSKDPEEWDYNDPTLTILNMWRVEEEPTKQLALRDEYERGQIGGKELTKEIHTLLCDYSIAVSPYEWGKNQTPPEEVKRLTMKLHADLTDIIDRPKVDEAKFFFILGSVMQRINDPDGLPITVYAVVEKLAEDWFS
jgi:hypothetical protein